VAYTTVDQTYDVFNRRIKRSVVSYGSATPVEAYFSHEGGHVALQFERSIASSLSHRYLWGPTVDQLLADEKVTSLASAGAAQYPLGDHLGTLRALATYDVTRRSPRFLSLVMQHTTSNCSTSIPSR